MRSLILVLLVACTRYVQVPQNVAPPAAASPAPTPNRARVIAESYVVSAEVKCIPWTGRESAYPGVDSFLCVAPSQLIYVAAPADGMPIIKIALQSESPPEPPKTEPPKPAPAKPEPKKK